MSYLDFLFLPLTPKLFPFTFVLLSVWDKCIYCSQVAKAAKAGIYDTLEDRRPPNTSRGCSPALGVGVSQARSRATTRLSNFSVFIYNQREGCYAGVVRHVEAHVPPSKEKLNDPSLPHLSGKQELRLTFVRNVRVNSFPPSSKFTTPSCSFPAPQSKWSLAI